MSIYDHLRDYLGLQFSAGPAGSYLYKNRLIQGSLDPAAGIARDPAQGRDWLIEQALNQVKSLPAGAQYTAQELQAQALDYLDQLAAGYRHLERDWDVHYSQAMQARMGTLRRVIGERVSPMAYGQYDIVCGYGIRDKDNALQLAGTGNRYWRGGEIPSLAWADTPTSAGQVVGHQHEFYAELDEEYAQDVEQIVYSFENYDPDKPTFAKIETGRTSQARARWLASQLAGKTPEEAYVLIENALTNATTVAQMRQVLLQLLPVIGAGVVYLARTLDK